MEAYADPLKYYEPDPPNTTDPKEVAERLAVNDEEVCHHHTWRIIPLMKTLMTIKTLMKTPMLTIIDGDCDDEKPR